MTHQLRHVLAERLRHLMTVTPLTSQRKVGDRSGVAQSTIGRILATDVSATIDNVEAIAGAFAVSPVALLTPQDHAASGDLATLFQVCGPMPHEALAKVLAYARFVESQTAPPASRVRKAVQEMNIDRTTENTGAERGAIQRGARGRTRPAEEFNSDDQQQRTTRRAKGARRSN